MQCIGMLLDCGHSSVGLTGLHARGLPRKPLLPDGRPNKCRQFTAAYSSGRPGMPLASCKSTNRTSNQAPEAGIPNYTTCPARPHSAVRWYPTGSALHRLRGENREGIAHPPARTSSSSRALATLHPLHPPHTGAPLQGGHPVGDLAYSASDVSKALRSFPTETSRAGGVSLSPP